MPPNDAKPNRRTMNVNDISRDEWIVGGLALVLVLDLLFLPWSAIGVGAGAQSISITSTATGSPDGWLGVLGLLAVVALIADLIIDRLSPQGQLPSIRGSRAATRVVLAAAGVALLAFKLLLHIGSAGEIGFWAAVVLSGGLLYTTRRAQLSETAGR